MFKLAAQRIKAQYGLAGQRQRFPQGAVGVREKRAVLIRTFRGDG